MLIFKLKTLSDTTLVICVAETCFTSPDVQLMRFLSQLLLIHLLFFLS